MFKRKVIFLKEKITYEDHEIEYRTLAAFTSKKMLMRYFNSMVKEVSKHHEIRFDERTKTHMMGVIWGGGIRQWFMEEGNFLNKNYDADPIEIKITYL